MDKSVVVVKAVRTAVGRRNGGWSAVHPARLLGAAQRAVLDGIDPARWPAWWIRCWSASIR